MTTALNFALAYLPFYALYTSVAVQIPRYFASHLGLGLAVGGVFGLVRLIDIPVDPVLGLLMDRTRTRIGRYRPWMLLSVPVLMAATYMLYEAAPGVTPGYLLGWLLVMYLGSSILMLSTNAWASVLAPSYTQRSRIFGALASVGFVGSASVLFVPILAARAGKTEPEGIQVLGWFVLAVIPAAVLWVVARTREPIAAAPAHRFALGDYLSLLIRPNVLRIILADFLVVLGPAWTSALYFYFFKDSRGFSTVTANALLMLYMLAGLVGSPATAWLANRIGKHRAIIVTSVGYSLAWLAIYLSPKANFAVAAAGLFVAGGLAGGSIVMVRAITADIGDELRLETGRNQIGLLYALTNATTKLASALSITLTFAVLGFVGYGLLEKSVNNPAQVHSFELAYIAGPILFVSLAGACFFGFKLTHERHAAIRRELDARDALFAETAIVESVTANPSAVAPETRRPD